MVAALQDHMGDKGQQIEQVKHHREGLLAMAIVVFELVAMIFVHIDLLIFDLPARAPNAPDGGQTLGRAVKADARPQDAGLARLQVVEQGMYLS